MKTESIANSLLAVFHFFASLKLIIPALLLTTIVTIVGSLFPDEEIFYSNYYMGLLALLALGLLCTTIDRIPTMLATRGRHGLIGIVTTHIGVLVILGGIVFGNQVGFRIKTKLVEGEMTVIPQLPFVLSLEKLILEEYPPGTFGQVAMDNAPRKRQDSEIAIYRNGKLVKRVVTGPGRPADIDGTTLLPSQSDVGWYFELIATDLLGRERTIPVRPWAPPLIQLGQKSLMAHRVDEGASQRIQIFTLDEGKQETLGSIDKDEPLSLDGYSLALGSVKRYSGVVIYSRPQAPVLLVGCLILMAGLIWHFYYRNRTRTWSNKEPL